MKVAAKTRSAPESMKKNVERPRPVKPGEEMEKELEFVANHGRVQEKIMHFQRLGASSADPQQAVPGRRKVTPHAETKVAVKTRSTPESMQKVVEGSCSVKTAEEMENEPELGTNTLSVQELKNRFQPPSASSAAPQVAVPGERKMTSHAGHTVEINTTRAIESLRVELERVLSDKLAVLQKQMEVSQHGAPPQEELANTQTSLQAMSEKMQSLLTSLQNMEASRKQDLEILRGEMQGQIRKHLEAAKRSWTEERLLEMVNKLELLHVQQYKVDVTLDADTAHPRLQVSEDGKSVTDTGAIRRVPVKKERFDSHAFVLAKEGYTSGRLYWEVDVGKRRNWILGVAQETVTRKGEVVLSPQNGFWAIGLADGQEYGVHTDPWTRLTVSDRPQKIGMLLDISARNLSFYNVHQKKVLYTFTFDSDRSRQARLFPFFSTGSTAIKADTEPLQIA